MKKMMVHVCFLTVLCLSSMVSFANEEYELGDYEYLLKEKYESGDYEYYINDDGTVTISAWNSEDESEAMDLIIPEEIDGKTVTAIGEDAFLYCTNLSSVKIPETVTTIGEDAFLRCTNITSIELPKSLKTIEDYAFCFCTGLTSIKIPDSVTKIGARVFQACSQLENILVSSKNENYAVIDGVLFNKKEKTLVCYPGGLGEVSLSGISYAIPEGILSIMEGAFVSVDLTSIEIPKTVSTIESGAFDYCSRLEKIEVSPDNEVFEVKDGVLFNIKDNTLVCYPGGFDESEYTIPKGTQKIGGNAFYYNRDLTSIKIPDSLTTIGEGAFSRCESLTTINIPSSVTTIGDEAFYECYELKSIEIPESVTTIGEKAFYECSNLSSIKLPGTVTEIGRGAFSHCDALTLTVEQGSYVEEYAEKNELTYIYSDADNWLNE